MSLSTDPNIKRVFDEFPMVTNFVLSWVNERNEARFLEDWRAGLGRGASDRDRGDALQSSHGSNEPLAKRTVGRKFQPRPRRVILREPVMESEDEALAYKSKGKKKAKRIETDSEMQESDSERAGPEGGYQRRQPRPTSETYDSACSYCEKNKVECVKDYYGGACVACKTRKTRCRHSGRGEKETKKRKKISVSDGAFFFFTSYITLK